MLTTQLRELENDGYFDRKVYARVSPKTEYSLTIQGEEMIGLIKTIRNFGLKMIDKQTEKKEWNTSLDQTSLDPYLDDSSVVTESSMLQIEILIKGAP